jgi:hypothetical protein
VKKKIVLSFNRLIVVNLLYLTDCDFKSAVITVIAINFTNRWIKTEQYGADPSRSVRRILSIDDFRQSIFCF